MKQKRLTVFTSLYNSENVVEALYQSLCRQTSQDFLWLCIDDGSSDGTRQKIEEFKNGGALDIEYHYQTNGGKHRAMNHAINYADTELFVTIDHDDFFLDDTVEVILSEWDKVKNDRKIIGLLGYRADKRGKVYGDGFVEMEKGAFHVLMRGACFDTTIIFDVSKLKNYCYPVFEDEKWAQEAYLYRKMDYDGYMFQKIERPFIITEYLPTGMTRSGECKYPKSLQCYYNLIAENEKNIKERIKARALEYGLEKITGVRLEKTRDYTTIPAWILKKPAYMHYKKKLRL